MLALICFGLLGLPLRADLGIDFSPGPRKAGCVRLGPISHEMLNTRGSLPLEPKLHFRTSPGNGLSQTRAVGRSKAGNIYTARPDQCFKLKATNGVRK